MGRGEKKPLLVGADAGGAHRLEGAVVVQGAIQCGVPPLAGRVKTPNRPSASADAMMTSPPPYSSLSACTGLMVAARRAGR